MSWIWRERELFLVLVRWHDEECGLGGNANCFSCWSWSASMMKMNLIWRETRIVSRTGGGLVRGEYLRLQAPRK